MCELPINKTPVGLVRRFALLPFFREGAMFRTSGGSPISARSRSFMEDLYDLGRVTLRWGSYDRHQLARVFTWSNLYSIERDADPTQHVITAEDMGCAADGLDPALLKVGDIMFW